MSGLPITTATAPGKVILLGEHAVVYGRPAIAVPVWQVVATAYVQDGAAGTGCVIVAHDLNERIVLRECDDRQPLALVTRLALAELGIAHEPDWQIDLRSTVPIAGGLGSGAALSTALVRGIFAHVGQSPAADVVSRIVYASEQIYHGTPSGIDNTVIAYGTPIWFERGQRAEPFMPGQPFYIAIADSGVRSHTKEAVGDVRRAWEADRQQYERYFDAIADCVLHAREAIAAGDWRRLGALMDEDQGLLDAIGVNSPELQRLVEAARRAGALGAKLSGAGRGGNMIALVTEETAEAVEHALLRAGAVRVIVTKV